LTEPSRIEGSHEHLQQAAAALQPLNVPAMRKDFLVHPYQVLEARAAGAGGILLIVRMLSRSQTLDLLDAAAAQQLFVLLEAFDAEDLNEIRELYAGRPAATDEKRRGERSRCAAHGGAGLLRCTHRHGAHGQR
jgi:indole-3-glycerol phosphate synthase